MQYNMTLQPIPIDVDKTKATFAHPECQKLFEYYPAYYYKVGYNPPWIGYFVVRDEVIVGCCGFTGQPKDGNVEIAYGTFKDFEGQGIASFSCRELVSISKKTNPAIIITAKTLPEKNASTKILERNGFVFSGIVPDEDEGDVWGWTYKIN